MATVPEYGEEELMHEREEELEEAVRGSVPPWEDVGESETVEHELEEEEARRP